MPTILQLMRAVRGSVLPPTDRHILMTLISLADPETGVIPDRFQPSFSDLAHYTGLGRSTVGRRLPFIEEAGWIKRTAPSLAAAWKDKEKNSYTILVPLQRCSEEDDSDDEEGESTSPRAGLVPEGDQSDDQSQSGTSPTAGLALVPEGDRTSPTAGLEVPGLRAITNQPPPSEEERTGEDGLFPRGQAGPTTAATTTKTKPQKRQRRKRAATEEHPEPNAGTIVGELIDICKANGIQLPKDLIGRYGKAIAGLRDQNFDDDLIRRTLSDMVAEGVIEKVTWLSDRIVAAQARAANPQRARNRQPRSNQHEPHFDADPESYRNSKI